MRGHQLSLLRRAWRLCRSERFPHLQAHAPSLPLAELDLGEVIVVHGQALSDREPGKRMTFLYQNQACSVEDLVLLHSQAEGW